MLVLNIYVGVGIDVDGSLKVNVVGTRGFAACRGGGDAASSCCLAPAARRAADAGMLNQGWTADAIAHNTYTFIMLIPVYAVARHVENITVTHFICCP